MVGVRIVTEEEEEGRHVPPLSLKCSGGTNNGDHRAKLHRHHHHQALEIAHVKRIGAGLLNLGNTCFLNSVIQCLTYTPPLAAYLQANLHKSSCQVRGFCAMCALENHAKQALSSAPGRVLSPTHLVKNLRAISRSFQMWRQEDAHEYMRYLIEALQKCCPHEAFPGSFHKNYIERVFGGRLRSQVKCTQCSHCSNTYDPFLDLSLEIVKAESIEKALARFTAVEVLDGNNKYQCSKCKKKVRAFKQFTIDHAPHVLAIQLKRFSTSGGFGGKIDKKVHFDRTFDIKPYVNRGELAESRYSLYAVLVHSGWSTHSGHYYCFVRTIADTWHVLDDSRVSQVSEKTVLDQKAYMLFYIRDVKILTSSGMIDYQKSTDFGVTKVNGNGISVTKSPEKSTSKHQNSEGMLRAPKGIDIAAAKVNGNSSTYISDNKQCKKETSSFKYMPNEGETSSKLHFRKGTDVGFTKVNGDGDPIGKSQEKCIERDQNSESKRDLSSGSDVGNHHSGRKTEFDSLAPKMNGNVSEYKMGIVTDPAVDKASVTISVHGNVAEVADPVELNLKFLKKSGHDSELKCKPGIPVLNSGAGCLDTAAPLCDDAEECKENNDICLSKFSEERPTHNGHLLDEWPKVCDKGKMKKVRKKQISEQNVLGLYQHTKRRKMSGEVGKNPFQVTNGSQTHDKGDLLAPRKKHRKKQWIFGLKLFLRRHRFKQMVKAHQDGRKTTN